MGKSRYSCVGHRVVALALCFLMVLTEPLLVLASVPAQLQSETFGFEKNGQSINILEPMVPAEHGKIDLSVEGKSGKKIFYIQDARDSVEAQTRISKIISRLVERYGVKKVYEEGHEGEYQSDTYFSEISDPEEKNRVSYLMLDALRIGGAEYAHINRTQDFQLVGADDAELHMTTIHWYRSMAKSREETKVELTEIETLLRNLIHSTLSKNAQDFIRLKEKYEMGDVSAFHYIQNLYSLLSTLRGTGELHDHYRQISSLMRASQSSELPQEGELSPGIDMRLLIQEVKSAENAIIGHMAESRSEKRLLQYYESIQLIKRLNNLEITPSEFEIVKNSIASVSTRELADFIAKKTKKTIILSRKWEENIQSGIQFYETALARDHRIEEHIKAFAEGEDQAAVLVFGGFHRDKIVEIFEKYHLSYDIITPSIGGVSERHRQYYKRLMSGGLHDYEIAYNLSRASTPPRLTEIYDIEGIQSVLKKVLDVTRSSKGELTPEILARRIGELSIAAQPASIGQKSSNPVSDISSNSEEKTVVRGLVSRALNYAARIINHVRDTFKAKQVGRAFTVAAIAAVACSCPSSNPALEPPSFIPSNPQLGIYKQGDVQADIEDLGNNRYKFNFKFLNDEDFAALAIELQRPVNLYNEVGQFQYNIETSGFTQLRTELIDAPSSGEDAAKLRVGNLSRVNQTVKINAGDIAIANPRFDPRLTYRILFTVDKNLTVFSQGYFIVELAGVDVNQPQHPGENVAPTVWPVLASGLPPVASVGVSVNEESQQTAVAQARPIDNEEFELESLHYRPDSFVFVTAADYDDFNTEEIEFMPGLEGEPFNGFADIQIRLIEGDPNAVSARFEFIGVDFDENGNPVEVKDFVPIEDLTRERQTYSIFSGDIFNQQDFPGARQDNIDQITKVVISVAAPNNGNQARRVKLGVTMPGIRVIPVVSGEGIDSSELSLKLSSDTAPSQVRSEARGTKAKRKKPAKHSKAAVTIREVPQNTAESAEEKPALETQETQKPSSEQTISKWAKFLSSLAKLIESITKLLNALKRIGSLLTVGGSGLMAEHLNSAKDAIQAGADSYDATNSYQSAAVATAAFIIGTLYDQYSSRSEAREEKEESLDPVLSRRRFINLAIGAAVCAAGCPRSIDGRPMPSDTIVLSGNYEIRLEKAGGTIQRPGSNVQEVYLIDRNTGIEERIAITDHPDLYSITPDETYVTHAFYVPDGAQTPFVSAITGGPLRSGFKFYNTRTKEAGSVEITEGQIIEVRYNNYIAELDILRYDGIPTKTYVDMEAGVIVTPSNVNYEIQERVEQAQLSRTAYYDIFVVGSDELVTSFIKSRSYEFVTSSLTISSVDLPDASPDGNYLIHTFTERCTASISACASIQVLEVRDALTGETLHRIELANLSAGDLAITNARFETGRTHIIKVTYADGMSERYDAATGNLIEEAILEISPSQTLRRNAITRLPFENFGNVSIAGGYGTRHSRGITMYLTLPGPSDNLAGAGFSAWEFNLLNFLNGSSYIFGLEHAAGQIQPDVSQMVLEIGDMNGNKKSIDLINRTAGEDVFEVTQEQLDLVFTQQGVDLTRVRTILINLWREAGTGFTGTISERTNFNVAPVEEAILEISPVSHLTAADITPVPLAGMTPRRVAEPDNSRVTVGSSSRGVLANLEFTHPPFNLAGGGFEIWTAGPVDLRRAIDENGGSFVFGVDLVGGQIQANVSQMVLEIGDIDGNKASIDLINRTEGEDIFEVTADQLDFVFAQHGVDLSRVKTIFLILWREYDSGFSGTIREQVHFNLVPEAARNAVGSSWTQYRSEARTKDLLPRAKAYLPLVLAALLGTPVVGQEKRREDVEERLLPVEPEVLATQNQSAINQKAAQTLGVSTLPANPREPIVYKTGSAVGTVDYLGSGVFQLNFDLTGAGSNGYVAMVVEFPRPVDLVNEIGDYVTNISTSGFGQIRIGFNDTLEAGNDSSHVRVSGLNTSLQGVVVPSGLTNIQNPDYDRDQTKRILFIVDRQLTGGILQGSIRVQTAGIDINTPQAPVEGNPSLTIWPRLSDGSVAQGVVNVSSDQGEPTTDANLIPVNENTFRFIYKGERSNSFAFLYVNYDNGNTAETEFLPGLDGEPFNDAITFAARLVKGAPDSVKLELVGVTEDPITGSKIEIKDEVPLVGLTNETKIFSIPASEITNQASFPKLTKDNVTAVVISIAAGTQEVEIEFTLPGIHVIPIVTATPLAAGSSWTQYRSEARDKKEEVVVTPVSERQGLQITRRHMLQMAIAGMVCGAGCNPTQLPPLPDDNTVFLKTPTSLPTSLPDYPEVSVLANRSRFLTGYEHDVNDSTRVTMNYRFTDPRQPQFVFTAIGWGNDRPVSFLQDELFTFHMRSDNEGITTVKGEFVDTKNRKASFLIEGVSPALGQGDLDMNLMRDVYRLPDGPDDNNPVRFDWNNVAQINFVVSANQVDDLTGNLEVRLRGLDLDKRIVPDSSLTDNDIESLPRLLDGGLPTVAPFASTRPDLISTEEMPPEISTAEAKVIALNQDSVLVLVRGIENFSAGGSAIAFKNFTDNSDPGIVDFGALYPRGMTVAATGVSYTDEDGTVYEPASEVEWTLQEAVRDGESITRRDSVVLTGLNENSQHYRAQVSDFANARMNPARTSATAFSVKVNAGENKAFIVKWGKHIFTKPVVHGSLEAPSYLEGFPKLFPLASQEGVVREILPEEYIEDDIRRAEFELQYDLTPEIEEGRENFAAATLVWQSPVNLESMLPEGAIAFRVRSGNAHPSGIKIEITDSQSRKVSQDFNDIVSEDLGDGVIRYGKASVTFEELKEANPQINLNSVASIQWIVDERLVHEDDKVGSIIVGIDGFNVNRVIDPNPALTAADLTPNFPGTRPSDGALIEPAGFGSVLIDEAGNIIFDTNGDVIPTVRTFARVLDDRRTLRIFVEGLNNLPEDVTGIGGAFLPWVDYSSTGPIQPVNLRQLYSDLVIGVRSQATSDSLGRVFSPITRAEWTVQDAANYPDPSNIDGVTLRNISEATRYWQAFVDDFDNAETNAENIQDTAVSIQVKRGERKVIDVTFGSELLYIPVVDVDPIQKSAELDAVNSRTLGTVYVARTAKSNKGSSRSENRLPADLTENPAEKTKNSDEKLEALLAMINGAGVLAVAREELNELTEEQEIEIHVALKIWKNVRLIIHGDIDALSPEAEKVLTRLKEHRNTIIEPDSLRVAKKYGNLGTLVEISQWGEKALLGASVIRGLKHVRLKKDSGNILLALDITLNHGNLSGIEAVEKDGYVEDVNHAYAAIAARMLEYKVVSFAA